MARVTHEFELPSEHRLNYLAPRVEGLDDYTGEYGYALCLDANGRVLILWDDDGTDWVPAGRFVFLS